MKTPPEICGEELFKKSKVADSFCCDLDKMLILEMRI